MSTKMNWEFDLNSHTPTGNFKVKNSNRVNHLYFPLFNLQGFMSAVTPELKGDVKTGQNTFLIEPQVTESIIASKNSRNFWIKTEDGTVWSIPGISAEEQALKIKNPEASNTEVQAGPGYFSIIRTHATLPLKAKITIFVPSTGEPLEIALIEIQNTGDTPLSLTPTTAIPLYGRSADNLRDHRQVTTLLNRIQKDKNGFLLIPTMTFDERGHAPGNTTYSAHAFTNEKKPLDGIVSDLETFVGEGGSLEIPELIYSDLPFEDPWKNPEGRQVIAALRFSKITLAPGEKKEYTWVLGIHEKNADVHGTIALFNSTEKVNQSLKTTKAFWKNQSERLLFITGNPVFDNWMLWVSLQPLMRRVFGCSFLPDFGYGRGGRGWRDLWQDCLGILLTNPGDARELLLNNIQGIRIDGSNATIIGSKPGEFKADRNNIPRTWMDHGVWPLITIDFYIQQTGDIQILLENRPLFFDCFSHRCKKNHPERDLIKGYLLKNPDGTTFETAILFHLLLQNVTQFYNRGEHGNIRLEDADWNDGLDMAHQKGESVPFSAAYAGNLKLLAKYIALLKEKGISSFEWPEEVQELFLNTFSEKQSNDPDYLQSKLKEYFNKVENGITGKMKNISLSLLEKQLQAMHDALAGHIQKNEFVNTNNHEYFNGYYDNKGVRVEGLIDGKEQMSLTAQVFPIMSGVATEEQCKKAFIAADELLKDPSLGGFRLNTQFPGIMLDVGRAYSFAYGEKENGSFFSHMNVMFANALYKRNLVNQGFAVIDSIFSMCSNTNQSLIFPCIPEYLNNQGRGRYCYITGSASWLTMTMLVEVFGIKGAMGKLSIAPKLVKQQFQKQNKLEVQTIFRGKQIKITYHNPNLLSFGEYKIDKLMINQKPCDCSYQEGKATINADVKDLPAPVNIDVFLEKN